MYIIHMYYVEKKKNPIRDTSQIQYMESKLSWDVIYTKAASTMRSYYKIQGLGKTE